MKLSVIGGGHGCYAAAAELSEHGHEVCFWRRDAEAFADVLRDVTITVKDFKGERKVKIARPTTSLKEAMAHADLLVCPLPATAQDGLAQEMAPYFTDGHVLFIPPGTLGSLTFRGAAAAAGNKADFAVAETGTLPYLVRKHGPAAIVVSGYATLLPTGIFPARKSDAAFALLEKAYASVRRIEDALSGALMNAGPIIHPPLILMNAGPLQHFPSWDIHNEGTQPAIRAVTNTLDNERIAVRVAFGYAGPHYPLKDHYSKDGEEWMYGRNAHEKLVDSGDWRELIDLHTHRYMLEDTRLGLSLIVSAGRKAGCPTPVASGLLAIASAVTGKDLYAQGRTLESFGLADMSNDRLKTYFYDGR